MVSLFHRHHDPCSCTCTITCHSTDPRTVLNSGVCMALRYSTALQENSEWHHHQMLPQLPSCSRRALLVLDGILMCPAACFTSPGQTRVGCAMPGCWCNRREPEVYAASDICPRDHICTPAAATVGFKFLARVHRPRPAAPQLIFATNDSIAASAALGRVPAGFGFMHQATRGEAAD